MPDWTAKERDVLQLLKNLRPYETAFGGAMPLDESHVAEASYGPAGLVFGGQEFEPRDVVPLGRSLGRLKLALRVLRHEDFAAWASLVEPYLGDPADAGSVDEWRRRVGALDDENVRIGRENAAIERENARRARKNKPPKRMKEKRVGLVFARLQLERHDRAIRRLAQILSDHDLHPVYPKLMSEKERGEMEKQNAEAYALYQRLRVSGLKHDAACAQAGEMLGIPADAVERIVEFRDDVRPETCIEDHCDDPVFQQNRCTKHYWRAYRAEKRTRKYG